MTHTAEHEREADPRTTSTVKEGWRIERTGWANEGWRLLRLIWCSDINDGEWMWDYPFPAAQHFPTQEFAERVMINIIGKKDHFAGAADMFVRPPPHEAECYIYDHNGDLIEQTGKPILDPLGQVAKEREAALAYMRKFREAPTDEPLDDWDAGYSAGYNQALDSMMEAIQRGDHIKAQKGGENG